MAVMGCAIYGKSLGHGARYASECLRTIYHLAGHFILGLELVKENSLMYILQDDTAS